MAELQRFLPPGELYRRARKVEELARVVMDCTSRGCALRDVARATKIMSEISAIVGAGEE
ncbi:hypothetical protein [Sphingobium sp. MI1205]|uniref:hypothetical protein n=1 Tax=Sphingobium sp. MI1205 TaxID=407020 RepID=UPI000782F630|nr:hypothetical protein [Sphingobium sp. MI1205]